MAKPIATIHPKPKPKNKGGRPPMYSATELAESIQQYFEDCANFKQEVATNTGVKKVSKPRIPTMGGLCNHLKISRETLSNWRDKPEFVDIIKDAESIIDEAKEDALVNGDGNTTGLIFFLKAKKGWADKQILEHQGDVNVTLKLDS